MVVPRRIRADDERMTCVLSIGEFARASGLSARALRLYDELDLLAPAEVDPRNGYRFYAEEQVSQARLVARLRTAGVPLPRIAAVLAASTPESAVEEVLAHWRQVEAERASAREVIASLVTLLQGQDDTMTASITPEIKIADLIAGVYDDLPDADALARVGEARRRSQALADLGDQLVDHYVREAKLAGATWAQIGEALGLEDHAAAERHGTNPFERFTRLSRDSIVQAQEAARTHGHDHIGTGHLLLGLLAAQQGLAYEILTGAATEPTVRARTEEAIAPEGADAPQGNIPFADESRTAIKQAVRAASDLGHDWVGTEHLLLALIRTAESPAAHVLRTLGLTPETLQTTIATRTADRSLPRE